MSAIRGSSTPAQVSVDQIRGDLPVSDLVTLASNGEHQAWDALIERYAPLVWSRCLRLGWTAPMPVPTSLSDGRHRGQRPASHPVRTAHGHDLACPASAVAFSPSPGARLQARSITPSGSPG